nr:reverse transcriptase domain-containing protein [Tanacetum cinerariifolium]
MSDYEDSIITYTDVSSLFGGLSDIGSPGVDGPPVMPDDPYAYEVAAFQAPSSPDYVPGSEYPPSPEFVPEPVYPEFMPTEHDILLAEEQPLPTAASPTIESPGYIDESDPEDDSEEEPEDDPKEDPADYPADGGDEGDDEDESSDDDEDDDIDIERDEEEDEYLAPADSTAVPLLAIDHAPSAEETEPFETDESAATPPPHPAYRAIGRPDLGESSAVAAARLREPVKDDLYRFVDTIKRGEGSTPAAMERVTELSTTFDRETSMIYAMIEEKQDDQALQRARVNMLFRDRRFHAHTARLKEGEARASRTAWTQSMDASDAAHSRVIALRGDQGVVGSTPQATCTVHTGTDCTEVMSDSADCSSRTHLDLRGCQSPSTTRAHDADRNTNGDDSHVSRTGVVELTQWFKKMKTVFRINNCSVENQIKFSTCTLLGSALTWWNSHVMTVGPDAAYAMTWVDMKKKMTEKYCPKGEMKKLESELWNLREKSNDVVSCSQRFQELALLCVRMFPEEADKIKRYVSGLPDVIHGSVVASRPKTMQEAIEMENELMDKRNNTWMNTKLRTKEKLMTLPEEIKANGNNRTRGKIPAWLTLRDLVKRNHIECNAPLRKEDVMS